MARAAKVPKRPPWASTKVRNLRIDKHEVYVLVDCPNPRGPIGGAVIGEFPNIEAARLARRLILAAIERGELIVKEAE